MGIPRIVSVTVGLLALGFVSLSRGMPFSEEPGTVHKKAVAFAAAGIQFFDLSSLNDRLGSNGISDFDDFAPTLSLGNYIMAGRLILGGDITAMLWRSRYDSNQKTSLRAGSLMMSTGFNLLSKDLPVRLYPLASIGAGLFKLRTTEDTRSFEDVLSSQTRTANLWQPAFLLSAGAGVDIKLPPIGNKHKRGTIGLRVGYLFDPIESGKWNEMGGASIENGPSPRMSGFHAAITLGAEGSKYPRDKRDR